MNWIVNNIQLTWKLARMLKTYKTCNWTVRFSKYEFYNKLLGGVILFRITPDVTWTQPYIYICMYVCMYMYVCIYIYIFFFLVYIFSNCLDLFLSYLPAC